MPTFGRTNVERATAASLAILDDAAILAASAEGRAMTPTQVLAEVEAGVPLPPERHPLGSGDPRGPAASLGLTPRELDVLRLVAEGLSDRAIAEALFVGPATVRAHLTNAYGKLGVGSRTAAVAAARRLGLL